MSTGPTATVFQKSISWLLSDAVLSTPAASKAYDALTFLPLTLAEPDHVRPPVAGALVVSWSALSSNSPPTQTWLTKTLPLVIWPPATANSPDTPRFDETPPLSAQPSPVV